MHFKVWWHHATLFKIYYFQHSFFHYNHTFIHPSPFAEARLLVSSSLVSSARGTSRGAEPRLELGPAVQQAPAKTTLPQFISRCFSVLNFCSRCVFFSHCSPGSFSFHICVSLALGYYNLSFPLLLSPAIICKMYI